MSVLPVSRHPRVANMHLTVFLTARKARLTLPWSPWKPRSRGRGICCKIMQRKYKSITEQTPRNGNVRTDEVGWTRRPDDVDAVASIMRLELYSIGSIVCQSCNRAEVNPETLCYS